MSKKILIALIPLLLLSSCASLYSGQDSPVVSKDQIKTMKYTVTFRFIRIYDYKYISRGNIFRLTKLENDRNIYSEYLNELQPFQKNEYVEFPFQAVEINNEESFKKIITDTFPKVSTEYFVDIHIKSPIYHHGSGLGMWGGLLSTLTLGILPAWWISEQKYEVNVYKNGKNLKTLRLEENYHIYQSTLFHLVPSSEYIEVAKSKLSRIDKNVLRSIIKEIQALMI